MLDSLLRNWKRSAQTLLVKSAKVVFNFDERTPNLFLLNLLLVSRTSDIAITHSLTHSASVLLQNSLEELGISIPEYLT